VKAPREVELAEEAVSAATTAGQDQDNPDEFTSIPTTAAAVITEEAVSTATAAQNQNQPNTIKSASSVSASTVTTAVCCCYITHDSSSIKV